MASAGSTTQEGSQFQQNPFQFFVDLQNKWADTAKEMGTSGKMPDMPWSVDPFTVAKSFADTMRQVVEASGDASSKVSSHLPNLLNQIQATAKTYASVLNFWAEMSKWQQPKKNGGSDVDGFSGFGFIPNWSDSMPNFGPFKPFDVKSTFGGSWTQAATQMGANWSDFVSDMSKRASSAFSEDKFDQDSMKNIFSTWQKGYEATFGRLINFPTIGPARYDAEIFERSVDAMIKYQIALSNYQAKMMQTGVIALQEVISDAEPLLKDTEITEETFDKFFTLLLNVGEKHYQTLFTSEQFCNALENLVSSGLEAQQSTSQVVEEMLKSTPIVTQTQADEIHQEIYNLKKQVRDLEQKLKNKGAK